MHKLNRVVQLNAGIGIKKNYYRYKMGQDRTSEVSCESLSPILGNRMASTGRGKACKY